MNGSQVLFPNSHFFIAFFVFVFSCCTLLIVEYYGTQQLGTRTYSMGRYDLEFAASVALGLDSRSRASLPLRSRARVPPRCSLSIYSTLVQEYFLEYWSTHSFECEYLTYPTISGVQYKKKPKIGHQFVVVQSAFLRQSTSTLSPTPLFCDLRPQY